MRTTARMKLFVTIVTPKIRQAALEARSRYQQARLYLSFLSQRSDLFLHGIFTSSFFFYFELSSRTNHDKCRKEFRGLGLAHNRKLCSADLNRKSYLGCEGLSWWLFVNRRPRVGRSALLHSEETISIQFYGYTKIKRQKTICVET